MYRLFDTFFIMIQLVFINVNEYLPKTFFCDTISLYNNLRGEFMPPVYEYDKVPSPRSVGDVPRFLKELLGGFFKRFFYIVGIVWQTGHWILFLMTFLALFNGLTPVIGALLSKEIINELQAANTPVSEFFHSRIFMLLIYLFIYRVLKRLALTAGTAVDSLSGELVIKQIKLRIMNKSHELDLQYFDLPEFYEKLENANREAGMRPIQVITKTFTAASTLIELISYIAVMATAPGLGLAAFIIMAVSLPSAIISFIYRKRNFNYKRRRSKDRREMNYYSDVLVNKDIVKEVRIFGLTDFFADKFKKVFGEYFKGLRALVLSESLWQIALGTVSVIVNLFFCGIVALRVLSGEIMLGDYTLYTGAIMSIATCIATLISTSAGVYEGTLFIDNLMYFMNKSPSIVPTVTPGAKVKRDAPHTIEFKNVSFHYPGSERCVLQNINITFSPGQTTVLVGLNGAGKTTLIKLLTRLYDPTDGVILLDGRDIREYDLESLYGMFGIIFQDFGRYAVTVGENISFGDLSLTPSHDSLMEAARQSNADGFIEKLPQGIDTPLTRQFERTGSELSGGQWQKLAIARAFYSRSDILVLDEPTASLDPLAEQEIFNEFDRLRSGKMSIFVSHRLSSATTAGQIIVLEGGRVVEKGTHKELMEQKGKYYNLFSVQAKRYVEGTK